MSSVLKTNGYKKMLYMMFVVYFSVMIVFIMPVKRVEANPLALIVTQVGRVGFQKAAQRVGIAVASRAGVKMATGPAAKTAYKAWFQRSGYASSTLATGAKNVGVGNTPGWLKVLLGGTAASSLISQTNAVYQDIKDLVIQSGGVLVGKPGNYEGKNVTFENIDGYTPFSGDCDPVSFDMTDWVLDVPSGININKGDSFVVHKNGYDINTNEVFVYIPNYKPVAVKTGKGTLLISCYPTGVTYKTSYWSTSYRCDVTFIGDNGIVKKYSGSSSCYFSDVRRDTMVAPICGYILDWANNTNYGKGFVLVPFLGPGISGDGYINLALNDIIPIVGNTLVAWDGSVPDNVVYDYESLAASNMVFETPSASSDIESLVVQVPDPEYWQQQNPTYSEEELEDLMIEILRNNPEIISQAENEVINNPESLPNYFTPEDVGEEPTEDPIEPVSYVSWLDQIVEYLRKIWESVNPAGEDFFLYKAFVPSEGFMDTAVTDLNVAVGDRFGFVDSVKSAVNDVIGGNYGDDDWDGIWINHPLVGEVCVVSPDPTNTYRSDIKKWIGGAMIFLTLLVTIRKVAHVLGGDN